MGDNNNSDVWRSHRREGEGEVKDGAYNTKWSSLEIIYSSI